MVKVMTISEKILSIPNKLTITFCIEDGFEIVMLREDEKRTKKEIELLEDAIEEIAELGGQMIIRENMNIKLKSETGEKDVYKLYGLYFDGEYCYSVDKERMKEAYEGMETDGMKEIYDVLEI